VLKLNSSMTLKVKKNLKPTNWENYHAMVSTELRNWIRKPKDDQNDECTLPSKSKSFFFINYSIPIRNCRVHKQLCFSINWAKSPEFLLQFNLLLDFAPEMVFKIKKLLLISSIAYTLLFVQSTMSIPSKSEDHLVNMNKFGYFLYTFKANTIR